MRVLTVDEQDDGSAVVTFDMEKEEKDFFIKVGLSYILKKACKRFYPSPIEKECPNSLTDKEIMDRAYNAVFRT